MTRIASRLFVSAAFAAGGFLAMTGMNAGAEDLPPASAQVAVAQSETDGAVVDLSGWQETRLVVGKTSNVIPTQSTFLKAVKTKAAAVPAPAPAKPVVPVVASKATKSK